MKKSIKVTYEELQKKCILLAEKIAHSKFKPDMIVSITRWGLLSAYFLADILGIKSIETINISSKDEKISDDTKFKKDFSKHKVLIVDDLIDSGHTMKYIFLHYKFDHTNTKIAVIYNKKGASIKPDFFVEYIQDERIIFPYHR